MTIATTADTVLDRGETLGLRLTGLSGGGGSSRLGVPATATTTITDSGTVTVDVSATSASVAEGQAARLTRVAVGDGVGRRGGEVEDEDGTAGVRTTPRRRATSLTIAAGATSSTAFTVATTADTLSEDNETFRVEIAADSGNPLPAGVSLGTSSVTVTITDDAADALTATVASSAATAAEGSNAVFTVTLSGGTSTAPVVVNLRDLGERDVGDGLHRAVGVADHRAGVATGTVTIAITADTVLDRCETLSLTLTGLSGGGGSVEPGRREERRDHDHRQRGR